MLPVNRHRLWQLAADAGLIALAWWLAFQLRFDFDVPARPATLAAVPAAVKGMKRKAARRHTASIGRDPDDNSGAG